MAIQDEPLTGRLSQHAAERVAADQRTERRQVAAFLILTARYAAGEDDFCLLTDAVLPWDLPEGDRREMYKRLLEIDLEPDPDRCMRKAWEEAIAPVRELERSHAVSLDRAWLDAIELAVEAYGTAGGRFSGNTFLELVPAERHYQIGKAIQAAAHSGRYEVIGAEPSLLPARKRSPVKVYALRS